jgi:hypothetical protein
MAASACVSQHQGRQGSDRGGPRETIAKHGNEILRRVVSMVADTFIVYLRMRRWN